MERFKLKAKEGEKLIEIVSSVSGSKKKGKKLIDEGLVSVNFKKELFYRKRLKANDVVIFSIPKLLFKVKKPKLLYQKEGVWVFDKPPFLKSNEGRESLEWIIRKKFKESLRVVHRLDKQTSGAIIAVEDEKLFLKFKELFKRRLINKEYTALIKGKLKKKLKITTPLEGKDAITNVMPVEKFKSSTLCKVIIETGRKHQIRKHLSLLGKPIVGEFLYYRGTWKEDLLYSPRILLHSKAIEFNHPITGERVKVEAELPEDFKEFLNYLRERGA